MKLLLVLNATRYDRFPSNRQCYSYRLTDVYCANIDFLDLQRFSYVLRSRAIRFPREKTKVLFLRSNKFETTLKEYFFPDAIFIIKLTQIELIFKEEHIFASTEF